MLENGNSIQLNLNPVSPSTYQINLSINVQKKLLRSGSNEVERKLCNNYFLIPIHEEKMERIEIGA